MYGHHIKHIMDQLGEVANPARGQLKRKNKYFSCPRSRLRFWSRETGSAVPSRVSLLILHTQAESGAYSRGSSRFPRWRPFIHYMQYIILLPADGAYQCALGLVAMHVLYSVYSSNARDGKTNTLNVRNTKNLFGGHRQGWQGKRVYVGNAAELVLYSMLRRDPCTNL